MRLEIAAGDNPRPGYTHNDIRKLDHIEIVCDVKDLLSHLEPGVCDEICATHILEHFSYRETLDILNIWFNLLREKGLIHIEVPNAEWQARALINGEIDSAKYVYYTYGEQDHPYNFHYAAFTPSLLYKNLLDAGFKSIHVTDIGQVLVANGVK